MKQSKSVVRYWILTVGACSALGGGLVYAMGIPAMPESFTQMTNIFVPTSAVYSRFETASTTPPKPFVEHREIPSNVKAIYMSQCAAASGDFRSSLMKLLDETELNAVVVDIKDYSGTVAFSSETAIPGGKGCTVSDFKALVQKFHAHDVFVIGRLTVFQDPLYTKTHPEEAVQSKKGGVWKDRKGLSFVDVGSPPFHAYIIALAREAHDLGVDEINFDYIRYPSDGDMTDTIYTHSSGAKPEQLEKFFKKLSEGVRKDAGDHTPILSADLFGMVTTNYDDLNIGQVLERALPYFDYIAPMVYPSHYPTGFMGLTDVNAHPYEIVNYSMKEAVKRTIGTTTKIASLAYTRIGTTTPAIYAKPAYDKNKLRPWLQDFDYPVEYTPAMVQAQIKASHDAGLNSYLFWDPSNKYSSLKQVIAPQ